LDGTTRATARLQLIALAITAGERAVVLDIGII
jgi:hypothetical protein